MKYRAMLRGMPFVVGSVIQPAMDGDSEEDYREPPSHRRRHPPLADAGGEQTISSWGPALGDGHGPIPAETEDTL